MKKVLMALGFAFVVLAASAQQMNSRPLIWLGEIVDLSAKKEANLPIGSVAFKMLQTRFQSSPVFKLGAAVPVDLAQAEKGSESGSFYLDGTICRVAGEIQLDVRVFSVDSSEVVYSGFFTVSGENLLRPVVNKIVEVLGEELFRDILGRLELITSVGSADIYLDGAYFGKTDETGKILMQQLHPGSYKLRVLAEGYREHVETLSISPRRVARVNASLSEEPGSLLVQSSPAGAAIHLDGVEVGQTPLDIPQIETGEHNLVLRKPDYTESSQKIVVRSREQRRIQAELSILPGSVRIVSEPKGATVIMGGKTLGDTPLTQYDLAPGKYIMELRFPGYRNDSLPVEIKAGAQATYETTLAPKTARVNIDTQPQGVSVYLETDGVRTALGETPIRDKEVRLGRHSLRFEKEGYFPATKSAALTTEQPFAVEQDMKVKPGSLRVICRPDGAIVELDGVGKGKTPLALSSLEPGVYEIKVRNSMAEAVKTVEIKPNSFVTEEFELKKKPNRFHPAVIMATIALGAFLSVAGQ